MRWIRSTPLVLASLLFSACALPPHVIHYNKATEQFDSLPAYVGTGDRIQLVVKNSTAHADRYAAATSAEDLKVEPNRAALVGAADLKKIAGFPLSILSTATGRSVAAAPDPAPFNALFSPDILLQLDTTPAMDSRSDSIKSLTSFADTIKTRRTTMCNNDIAKLAEHLYAHPGDAATVAFILDSTSRETSRKIAHDPFPDTVLTELYKIAQDTMAGITAARVAQIRAKGDRYLHRIAALFHSLPAGPGLPTNPGGLQKHIESVRTCDTRPISLAASEDDRTGSEMAWIRLIESASEMSADSANPTPRWISNVNISELVFSDNGGRQSLDSLYSHLVTIAHNATRVRSTLNLFPYIAPGTPDTIHVGAFFSPKTVTLKVMRHDRYPTVPAPSLVLVQRPMSPSPQESDAEQAANRIAMISVEVGTREKANNDSSSDKEPTSNEAKESSKEKAGSASGAASQPTVVAQTSFDVLQRYRFRFAAGAARTPLRWDDFSTREDSTAGGKGVFVSRVGRSNSFIPLATLSYVLFPFEGKVFAANAYGGSKKKLSQHLKQAGVAAYAGLSLSDPTESFVLGLSTEPIPGLEFGYGMHIARAESSAADHGSFVPLSQGDPIQKEWQREWGIWSLTIDAGVVVTSFGTLLGLK